jgi:hypothetical protein
MSRSPLPVVTALVVTACTDADLIVPPEADLAVPRLRIEADVCAPAPVSELAPYKILFVIDTSYSNSWTDAIPADGSAPRREKAVRDVINEYLDYQNVSFGVITFSDVPRRQTFGFTETTTQTGRDVLDGATANIAQAQGGTNYGDTLWNAIDFIMTDVHSLLPADALSTHYLVFWLSDGFPTVGIRDPNSILPGVAYLEDWMRSRVAEFRFSTAFLGYDDEASLAEQNAARSLLCDMAEVGGGLFTDVAAGQPVEFSVDLEPVYRFYELAGVVANNRNVRFGQSHPFADSDGDGLLDVDEEDLELDPTDVDTDGDGFGDGIELELTLAAQGGDATYDPAKANPGCTNPGVDTDADGLGDCDELLLGTNRVLADTDNDGLPDSVEVAAGSSPTLQDPVADFDLDRISDEDEARGHLVPKEHNTTAEVERWSYRYLVTDLSDGELSSAGCYSIVVANLAVFETLAGPRHASGANDIDLWLAFTPKDGGGAVVFKRATRTARFLIDLDVLSPASALLEFDDSAFEALPAATSLPGSGG